MTLQHIILLAVVQGITEFLPISSSGHLILAPAMTGSADQGLLVDVAVHVGTLAAVLIYFWRDVFAMLGGFVRLFTGRINAGARLAIHIVLATIPVVCRSGSLNRTLIVRQNWIAASENNAGRTGLPSWALLQNSRLRHDFPPR